MPWKKNVCKKIEKSKKSSPTPFILYFELISHLFIVVCNYKLKVPLGNSFYSLQKKGQHYSLSDEQCIVSPQWLLVAKVPPAVNKVEINANFVSNRLKDNLFTMKRFLKLLISCLCIDLLSALLYACLPSSSFIHRMTFFDEYLNYVSLYLI